MKYQNKVIQISNYATAALSQTLLDEGSKGFKFQNCVIADNQYGRKVMYLFFVKPKESEE